MGHRGGHLLARHQRLPNHCCVLRSGRITSLGKVPLSSGRALAPTGLAASTAKEFKTIHGFALLALTSNSTGCTVASISGS